MEQAMVLQSSVLVLNKSYIATHITSARRAFSLLFKEHAEVVTVRDGDEFASYDLENWLEVSQLREKFPVEEHDRVQTVSIDIVIPKIVRLLFYDKLREHRVKFNRRNIFARDGSRCQYCGKKFHTSELSLDHVVPRSLGGKATWENVVCACLKCNVKKGGRVPQHAGMKLAKKPVRPNRNPLVQLKLSTDKYNSWKHFLNAAYWSVELRD